MSEEKVGHTDTLAESEARGSRSFLAERRAYGEVTQTLPSVEPTTESAFGSGLRSLTLKTFQRTIFLIHPEGADRVGLWRRCRGKRQNS